MFKHESLVLARLEHFDLLDWFWFLVMAFESGFGQHFAGNLGDEFGESTLGALLQMLLAGLRFPKAVLRLRERDRCIVRRQALVARKQPNEFRIGGEADRER